MPIHGIGWLRVHRLMPVLVPVATARWRLDLELGATNQPVGPEGR